ncbi:hypothetical protein C8J57DRAFT_1170923, partial [Mycena rebaudengoi]
MPSSVVHYGVGLEHRLGKSFVLKMCWTPAARRERESEIYGKIRNGFGTPSLKFAFEVTAETGAISSNAIYYEQSTFGPVLGGIRQKPPQHDVRSLWGYVFEDQGDTLEVCTSASELTTCILHALLGKLLSKFLSHLAMTILAGWLHYYQNDELHSDISIVNVLKIRGTVKREKFNLQHLRAAVERMMTRGDGNGDDDDPLGPNPASSSSSSSVGKKRATPEPPSDAAPAPKRFRSSEGRSQLENEFNTLLGVFAMLEQKAATLGVGDSCSAILNDADMALNLTSHFNPQVHNGALSGTPEFMSSRLINSILNHDPILHCPVDDLWSAFYVTVWAVVFNTEHPGPTAWQTGLRGSMSDRNTTIDTIFQSKQSSTPFLTRLWRTMADWRSRLVEMEIDWADKWDSDAWISTTRPKMNGKDPAIASKSKKNRMTKDQGRT